MLAGWRIWCLEKADSSRLVHAAPATQGHAAGTRQVWLTVSVHPAQGQTTTVPVSAHGRVSAGKACSSAGAQVCDACVKSRCPGFLLLLRRYGLVLAQPPASEQAARESAADSTHGADGNGTAGGSAGGDAGASGRRHLSAHQRRLLKKARPALLGPFC